MNSTTDNHRRDAYLRLDLAAQRVTRTSPHPDGPAALLFVDLHGPDPSADRIVQVLETLPPSYTTVRHLILRWAELTVPGTDADHVVAGAAAALAAEVHVRSRRLGFGQTDTGVAHFRLGAEPVLIWPVGSSGGTADEASLLGRCVRIELSSLLENGSAIWRPTSYHYVLPSGEHSRYFVRVGDAFRNTRDVEVVASWLARRLGPDVVFCADTSSLVPLLTELRAMCRAGGWTSSEPLVLDEVARTRADVSRAIRTVLKPHPGPVVALLSVCSSGRLRDLMLEALPGLRPGQDVAWSLTVLLDKTSSGADQRFEPVHDRDGPPFDTWLSLPGELTDNHDEAVCPDCRDNLRAQLVHIDPKSFQAMALPGVELVTPDVAAAARAVPFWNAVQHHEAVGVEAAPANTASVAVRPKEDPLAVRLFVERLLGTDEFHEALRTSLREQALNGRAVRYTGDNAFDGIVISTEEDSDQFRETLRVLVAEVGLPEDIPIEPVPPDASATTAVQDWRRALVVTIGSVSGFTMRQLLLSVQGGWEGKAGREIGGLILVARPVNLREWQSLSNSFSKRLDTGWRLYLPWRSPLREEATLLNEVDPNKLSPEARAFLVDRQDVTRPRRRDWHRRLADYDAAVTDGSARPPHPRSIFWGSPPRSGRPHVRTQSLYGFQVDAATTYAAVGAAMHSSRQQTKRYDPRQRMFEIPAIVRSYYDAPIIASVLRWAEPSECWWGRNAREGRAVLHDLVLRTTDVGDQVILLPELLLAAAQGKVPSAAADDLLALTEHTAAQWSNPDDRVPVELGSHLLRREMDRRGPS